MSLLSSLANQKIFIPSACGGKATCGLCKVTLMDNAGPELLLKSLICQKQKWSRGASGLPIKGEERSENRHP